MKPTNSLFRKNRSSRFLAAAVLVSTGCLDSLARSVVGGCGVMAFAAILFASRARAEPASQAGTHTNELVPLIVIDAVPLQDAIRNIARQMDLNCIFDPRILGAARATPGEPTISIRWHDLTMEEVLQRLLKAHRLRMVTNSVTSVARIVPIDAVATPVPLDQVETNTASPIPVLTMDSVPLPQAIRELAGRAGLKPSFTEEATDALSHRVVISFRWTKISARQALAALLDNYDLRLTEGPTKSSPRIALNSRPESRQLHE